MTQPLPRRFADRTAAVAAAVAVSWAILPAPAHAQQQGQNTGNLAGLLAALGGQNNQGLADLISQFLGSGGTGGTGTGGTGQTPTRGGSSPQPFRRIYQVLDDVRLVTNDPIEIAYLLPTGFWVEEGPIGQVLPGPTTSSDGVAAVPLRRFYTPANLDHPLTATDTEVQALRAAASLLQIQEEGVTGYVYPRQAAGTVPLLRLRNPSNQRTLYTTDATEAQNVATAGWTNDGAIAYILPKPKS
jgi:hypothetical protein